MKNGSILIITNEIQVGRQISDKVKLLREGDILQIVSYIEAISVLNSSQPSLIMVYCANADSIGIVKEIRAIKSLNKVPIILVMDSFIEDLLLYAFDNGIDDFFFLNDSDSVILMRILLTLQKTILYKQTEVYEDILVTAGIFDKTTGIYTEEQAPLALKNFFSKSIEENMENTVFMCLKPISLNGKKLNMQEVSQIIREIPRANDIVAYGKNLSFYLILYNSGVSGAKNIALRIKNVLSDKCNVYANAAEITTSFEDMESVLIKNLKDQISSGIEFNYLYNINIDDSCEAADIYDESKKFKDFKKEFYGKLEKIVAPVFYQMKIQTAEMFPDSQIDFDITETESIFAISKKGVTTELVITYPSYMKLLLDIKHTVHTKRPQVRRLSYDFDDFSQEKLSSILQDIIKEFEAKLNKNRIENYSDSELE